MFDSLEDQMKAEDLEGSSKEKLGIAEAAAKRFVRIEKSSVPSLIRRWCGIAFAAAVLAMTPPPLTADIFSVS